MRRGGYVQPALVSSLGFLDAGATVVVLPQLAEDLGLGLSSQQRVLSVALVSLGLLVVPGGAFADAVGRRRAGVAGLVVAAAAAALTATSGDERLLLWRALFGVGAALFLPAALAAASEEARGLRGWTVVVSVATLLAPALGSVALLAGGWQVLYAGEAVAAAALAAWWLARPEGARPRSHRPDRALGVMAVGAAAAVVVLVTPETAATRPALLVALAVAVGALARQLAGRVLPVPFLGLLLVTVASYAGFSALPFLVSTYAQGARGVPPLAVGALLALDALAVALLTPRLGRTDAPLPAVLHRVAVGAALCGAGAGLLACAEVLPFLPAVAAGLLVVGVGGAVFIAPLTAAALRVARADSSGLAAGVSLASARVAAALGLALVTSVAVRTAVAVAGPVEGLRRQPLDPPAGLGGAGAAAYVAGMVAVVALFFLGAVSALLTARAAAAATATGPGRGRS